jgi:hypothetical protein
MSVNCRKAQISDTVYWPNKLQSTFLMSKQPMIPPKVKNVLSNFEKTIMDNNRYSVTSGMYLTAQLSQANSKQPKSAGMTPIGGRRGKPASFRQLVYTIPEHFDDENCIDFTLTIDDTMNILSDDDDLSVVSMHSGSRRSSIGSGSRRGSIVSLQSNHTMIAEDSSHDRSVRSGISAISKTSDRIRALPRDLELSNHDSSYSSSSDEDDESDDDLQVRSSGEPRIAPRHW